MKFKMPICPLSMSGPAEMDLVPCTTECAWYDSTLDQCAILSISQNLDDVGTYYYNRNNQEGEDEI